MKQVAEKIQRLARIEVAIEIRFLRQITDARLGLHMPRRMAEHLDVPLGRIQQTEQQFDRGGFAGAVRPEQAEHFAAPDFEIHIVHRARLGPVPEIFEDFGQPAHGNDDFADRIADFRFAMADLIQQLARAAASCLRIASDFGSRSFLIDGSS